MSCATPTVTVGGIEIPTNAFANARELIEEVSGDQGDATLDEFEESVAGGNNTTGTTGVQVPGPGEPWPQQTTLPEPIPYTPDAVNESPAPGGNGSPVACPIWDGVNYNVSLSPNFQLRDFTIGRPVPGRRSSVLYPHPLPNVPVYGLSPQTRFCNLLALSVNIAEPMLAKFGPFRVNSGLRNDNSTSSGLSQHVSGQAIDIQFEGWTYARYWDNAQWIKENIKYDQFIFEHSDKTGLAWYHLSFKSTGNRPPTNPRKVMTMYRNKFSPGLRRYG